MVNANVSIKIHISKLNGSETSYEVILKDNGNGDPDKTAHDGIYSIYLIDYPMDGRWKIETKVIGGSKHSTYYITSPTENQEYWHITNLVKPKNVLHCHIV